jgi:hypothetical protein
MYRRKETGDYIWVVSLIAGICAVIAILTPTAHFGSGGVTWDWWMWDFTTLGVYGYPSVSLFVAEMDFIIPSIITTSAISLSAVNLFVLSITTRKKRLDTKNFPLMSTISAVLSISIMVYYAFAMASAFSDGLIIEGVLFPPGFHFWLEFSPSFGIIFPFISAILSFVGVGLFRRYSKQRGVFIPPKTIIHPETYVIQPNVPPKYDVAKRYSQASVPVVARNFCPECGHKIMRADTHFCTNCGFKL